jgi:hypothetical protein
MMIFTTILQITTFNPKIGCISKETVIGRWAWLFPKNSLLGVVKSH